MLGLAPRRAADDQDVVGDMGVGDEDLLAVDDEAAVDPLGRGRQRADVGAGLGLGHRDRLDRAAGDAAEDLALLVLGAEPAGRAGHDQRRRVAADRSQAPCRLFHEEAGVEHRASGTPVLLGDGHPEPAELRHLAVEVVAVVDLAAVGQRVALLTACRTRARRSRGWRRRSPAAHRSGQSPQARDETRTRDPFLTMEVLYQLSYPGGSASGAERLMLVAAGSAWAGPATTPSALNETFR